METASLVRQFAESTKADGDIKTAHNDIRLITANLVEMQMGKNINDLKARDPDDKRCTVFKEGVRAFSVRDLTRQSIRSYFANWKKFGSRIKDNYKKVFRKFLRWWADECEADGDLERADEIRRMAKSAIGKVKKVYAHFDPKLVLDADECAKFIDNIRDAEDVSSHDNVVRCQAYVAQTLEMGPRNFEIREMRYGDIRESPRYPDASTLPPTGLGLSLTDRT
ncbi:MAG: hypothetical protein V3U52_08660 [Thermoplasmata archaeon]